MSLALVLTAKRLRTVGQPLSITDALALIEGNDATVYGIGCDGASCSVTSFHHPTILFDVIAEAILTGQTLRLYSLSDLDLK